MDPAVPIFIIVAAFLFAFGMTFENKHKIIKKLMLLADKKMEELEK